MPPPPPGLTPSSVDHPPWQALATHATNSSTPADPASLPTRRICLTVEYDGTAYQGWQRQVGLPSIQAALEAALVATTGETANALKLGCAGRTDAGVHATGQLCSFVTRDGRQARRFAPALNHFLPPDIRVHVAQEVALSFDVRRASEAKWYRYVLYLGLHSSATLGRRVWHVRRKLDVAAMQAASRVLLGEHDFESFRSVHCDAAHARRNLMALILTPKPFPPLGQLITVDLFGNAFCRHMCRILVGTLVEVGAGQRPPTDVARILAAKDRRQAGMTAPPQGLCLRQIFLPGDGAIRPWQGPDETPTASAVP